MLRFTVLSNVAPLLVLLLKDTSSLLKSCHTTYTLLPDLAIFTFPEPETSLLKFIVGPKLFPPSVLLLNNISPGPLKLVSSTHTTYTKFPDTSIKGQNESPVLLLRFFIPPKIVGVPVARFIGVNIEVDITTIANIAKRTKDVNISFC